jgi:hypothetical protein
MGQLTKFIVFGDGKYRMGYVVISLGFDVGGKTPARVTVKLKPPGTLIFRRQRFEGRVLELLRRNGFCLDRKPTTSAAAAQ